MLSIPKAAEPLVSAFSVAFTRPTFQRVIVLFLGAIVSLRYRTVSGMLRAAGPLARCSGVPLGGHWSNFHRVLCCRVWSCWSLGKVLAALVLEMIPADQAVICPGDDTTAQHKGNRVYGKGCHRDACRSSQNQATWVWGHKWVTLSINVKFPFASRPWALPVLCALYRPADLNLAESRRHKSTLVLMRQLIATLIHWFPQRKFILLGDGGYSSHELARFCYRHRSRLTLVSRFYFDANLVQAPPEQISPKNGRPRIKGPKLPTPQETVKMSKAKSFTVHWYGGQARRVELIWGDGYWYRSGKGLIAVRWVFVHDLQGTHRDEYFFSTDPAIPPEQIVSLYTGRWSIEVTFQEARAHLGFATPRNWSKKSVLRTAPCLLGLYSVISLIFHRHLRGRKPQPMSLAWYSKKEVTFSDALTCVRRLCWQEVFESPPKHGVVKNLSGQLKALLLDQLSRAA
jgi:hypothetical protein